MSCFDFIAKFLTIETFSAKRQYTLAVARSEVLEKSK